MNRAVAAVLSAGRAATLTWLAFFGLAGQAFECPLPPPAIVTVAGIDFYIDDKHSVIDPRLEQQSVELGKAMRDSLSELGQMADSTGRARDPGSTACALGWLRQWAGQGAFSKLAKGGTVQRAVAVASASNAYRIVLARTDVVAADQALIGRWLGGLARSIVELEDTVRPGDQQNNVTYWSALAVFNIGVVNRDEGLKRWAAAVYQRALGSLSDRGYFPSELKRGKQALRYQWFALSPLVVLYVTSSDADGMHAPADRARLAKALAAAQAALDDTAPISRDAGTEVEAVGIKSFALTQTVARLSRCVAADGATAELGVPRDRDLVRDWRLGSAFALASCTAVASHLGRPRP